MNRRKKVTLAIIGLVAISAVGFTQIKQLIKIVGVGAAVKQFSPQINKAINDLSSHKDTVALATKVVPILSIGLGKSSAVGAAQVMGPKKLVDTVTAVAQPETELFGKEVRIRALIPVSSTDVIKDIKRVDGVGVSGIVDLKL